MTVIEQIQAFVQTTFHRRVAPSDSLLDAAIIDSVGIFQLVGFLGDRFGVEVADEDIVPEHFETVERIAALVAHRRGAARMDRAG